MNVYKSCWRGWVSGFDLCLTKDKLEIVVIEREKTDRLRQNAENFSQGK